MEQRLERAARRLSGERGGRERVVFVVAQRFVAVLGLFVGSVVVVIVVIFVVIQRFVGIALREIDVGNLVFDDVCEL